VLIPFPAQSPFSVSIYKARQHPSLSLLQDYEKLKWRRSGFHSYHADALKSRVSPGLSYSELALTPPFPAACGEGWPLTMKILRRCAPTLSFLHAPLSPEALSLLPPLPERQALLDDARRLFRRRDAPSSPKFPPFPTATLTTRRALDLFSPRPLL